MLITGIGLIILLSSKAPLIKIAVVVTKMRFQFINDADFWSGEPSVDLVPK